MFPRASYSFWIFIISESYHIELMAHKPLSAIIESVITICGAILNLINTDILKSTVQYML